MSQKKIYSKITLKFPRLTPRLLILILGPLITTVIQTIYTSHSLNQIRMEEFAESIRNVYWFNRGALYNYLSHHIGWYATVDLANQLIGFNLFTAKFLKIFIYYISSFSVGWLSLRYFKNWKYALIVYLSYVLSPTLLYFNSLQALFGTDLLYIPILLVLALNSWGGKKLWQYTNALLFGLLIMLSYFTYAVFYFSIPFILFVFVYIGYLTERKKSNQVKHLLKQIGLHIAAVIGGASLIIVYLWRILIDFKMLDFYIYLMKQGGQTYPHIPNLPDFITNLKHLLHDLFITGSSYHYELQYPDYSLIIPAISILTAIVILIIYRKKLKKEFPLLSVAGVMVLYNIFIIQYRNGPITDSGIRRSTIILLFLYFLYGLGWFIFSKLKNKLSKKSLLILVLLLLLPIHHIFVYIPNINSINKPSKYAYKLWFGDSNNSDENLNQFINDKVNQLEIEPLYLRCDNYPQEGRYDQCRYPEVYAALKMGCFYWQKDCKPIYGYDHKTGTMIEIKGALWDTEYWPL